MSFLPAPPPRLQNILSGLGQTLEGAAEGWKSLQAPKKERELKEAFGKQFGEGLKPFASQNLAEKLALGEQGAQQKSQELARKMQVLGELQETDWFQNQPEVIQQAIGAEAAGIIDGQTAKTIINAYREAEENKFIEGAEGMPFFGEEGEPGVAPSAQPVERPGARKPSKFAPGVSDERLHRMSAGKGAKAKWAEGILKKRDQEESQQFKREERNFKRNEKFFEEIDKAQKDALSMDLSLNQMHAALDKGDFESFRNKVGDLLGVEAIKTSSAQTVNSAMKTFLMSNLSQITGRPNQFIEQQLTKAAINPQYTKEANEAILEGLDIAQDLRKKKIEFARELENFFTSDGGEVPRNFTQLVYDKLNDYAEPRLKAYEESLTQLLGIEDKERKKVSPGTPITEAAALKYLELANDDLEKARKMAREDGYEF
jgi:hypothetical protein